MHTMWKGSISFGLVNIPIKMFSSTESKDIKFRYLHKECKTPIKYSKVCPTCDKDIGTDEIVKGYEFESGKFLIFEDSELEAIKPDIIKTIDILNFINLSDIDPIYFDKTYYLSPQDQGGKAYNLLIEAMKDTKKIGIAKIIIREKQSLAAVRVYNNILVLETIYYPDEIRSVELVPNINNKISLNEKELNMAIQLINNLTESFNPDKYVNNYREDLMELIHKKMKGEEIEVAPITSQKNIVDLMQALKASIDETEEKKDERKKPKKRTKKITAG